MPPKPSQHIVDRLAQFQQEEAVWVDSMVRLQWPRWVCYLGERRNLFGTIMALVIARFSGLEIKRNQHNELIPAGQKGYRKSTFVCNSVVSTVFKHQSRCKEVVLTGGEKARPHCNDACVVARREFKLGIPLTDNTQ